MDTKQILMDTRERVVKVEERMLSHIDEESADRARIYQELRWIRNQMWVIVGVVVFGTAVKMFFG